ncbi:Riboflavin synthase [compost metagenome]
MDGISLTVVEAEGGMFTISIIPHTLAETVLAFKRAGDTVNLECDVLGKYVDHLLKYGRGSGDPGEETGDESGINLPFLAANGFV